MAGIRSFHYIASACKPFTWLVIPRKSYVAYFYGVVLAGMILCISYMGITLFGEVAIPKHMHHFPKNTTFTVHVKSEYTIHIHPRTSFLDLRDSKRTTLRMFGHLMTEENEATPPFWCHVTTKTASWTVKGIGMMVTINDAWRVLLNRTAMFVCELPMEARYDESSVILHGTSWASAKLSKVGKRIHWDQDGKGFAVCLPTIFNITSPYIVAEWMEMQRLFGVTKIFLYDKYNISPEVDRVLNYYVLMGYLDIVTWNEPWRTGLFAHAHDTLLNHCLYTLMEDYEYIGVYDFDEFLIPKYKTYQDPQQPKIQKDDFVKIYPDMMRKIRTYYSDYAAAYRLERKRFCVPDKNIKAKDYTSLKASQFSLWKEEENFKSVSRPAYVVVLTVHEPKMYIKGYTYTWVKPSDGLIHHYRTAAKSCRYKDESVLVHREAVINGMRKCFKGANIPFTL